MEKMSNLGMSTIKIKNYDKLNLKMNRSNRPQIEIEDECQDLFQQRGVIQTNHFSFTGLDFPRDLKKFRFNETIVEYILEIQAIF